MAYHAFDAPLPVLNTEAERAAVFIRTVQAGWPWLEGLGSDPQSLIERLALLARNGKQLSTHALAAQERLRVAQALGREAAVAYVASLTGRRELLRGLLAVFPGELDEDVEGHLRLMADRPSPRLRGTLAHARDSLDDLTRADQPIPTVPSGAGVLASVQGWAERLEKLMRERAAAERAANRTYRASERHRVEMMDALREAHALWAAAVEFSEGALPVLTYELIAARRAHEAGLVRLRRRAASPSEACDVPEPESVPCEDFHGEDDSVETPPTGDAV